MRSKMLVKTKTEKRMIIFLIVVAIFNILGPLLTLVSFFSYSFDLFWASIIFWVISWIIDEILVVAVLILMIRKE